MAEVILMPRLSDTMTEGVIAAWHKNVGDSIKKGDLLADIETDKATMELESYKDGTLLHIGTDKGGKLQVDDLLAIVGKPGEDISSLLKTGGSASAEATANKADDKKQKTEKASSSQDKAAPKDNAPKPATSNQQPATIDISKMDEVVLMPRLSDTMEEGVIASWNKNVGDAVKKGDVLAEIETDKATMELESYKNGTLLYIGAQKGEKIPVNALLCIIGEKGKVDVDAIVAAVKVNTSQKSQISQKNESVAATQPVTSNEQPATETTQTAESVSSENGRVKASPLAKKLQKKKVLT
jgi:pyruvate dehydrogenase E2 component (dihydrolipoamide acetyltransferase)